MKGWGVWMQDVGSAENFQTKFAEMQARMPSRIMEVMSFSSVDQVNYTFTLYPNPTSCEIVCITVYLGDSNTYAVMKWKKKVDATEDTMDVDSCERCYREIGILIGEPLTALRSYNNGLHVLLKLPQNMKL